MVARPHYAANWNTKRSGMTSWQRDVVFEIADEAMSNAMTSAGMLAWDALRIVLADPTALATGERRYSQWERSFLPTLWLLNGAGISRFIFVREDGTVPEECG